MKTRELLKLNERQSLIEIEKGTSTEYCVCSYYDDAKPEGCKWCWGHYFSSLENAIKYAAKNCYPSEYLYLVMEFEDGNWSHQQFDNYDEAYKYIKDKFDECASDEDCLYSSMANDVYGNIECRLSFDGDYSIDMKLIEIQI